MALTKGVAMAPGNAGLTKRDSYFPKNVATLTLVSIGLLAVGGAVAVIIYMVSTLGNNFGLEMPAELVATVTALIGVATAVVAGIAGFTIPAARGPETTTTEPNAVSLDQIDKLDLGQSYDQVVANLGEPSKKSEEFPDAAGKTQYGS